VHFVGLYCVTIYAISVPTKSWSRIYTSNIDRDTHWPLSGFSVDQPHLAHDTQIYSY
jgi:hypothetical protein